MPVFSIAITQVFKATRTIVVPVEAETLEDAIEKQDEDFAPAFDHPGWKTKWDLQNEKVTNGGDEK